MSDATFGEKMMLDFDDMDLLKKHCFIVTSATAPFGTKRMTSKETISNIFFQMLVGTNNKITHNTLFLVQNISKSFSYIVLLSQSNYLCYHTYMCIGKLL